MRSGLALKSGNLPPPPALFWEPFDWLESIAKLGYALDTRDRHFRGAFPSMAADRKKKLRQRKKREKKVDQDRRARAEQFLTAMGIGSMVERLPHRAKELIWKCQGRRPVVCVEPGTTESDQLRKLVARATTALNERKTVTFLKGSYYLSYSDYIAEYEPLISLLLTMCDLALLGEVPTGIDLKLAADLWQKASAFDDLGRLFLLAELSLGFESVFCEASSLEECASHRLKMIQTESNQQKPTFYVAISKAERLCVNIDGAARTVFRCYSMERNQGLQYRDVPGELLSSSRESERVPVYIQRHAIDRLEERLGVHNPAFLTMLREQSLLRPVVFQRNDGSFLIEVRIGPHRIGYFVAERCGPVLVIRTFLFLTMQGTPEADLLRSELSLRPADRVHDAR